MINKSKIDAVFPGETDNVILVLNMDAEYDLVTVEPDIELFYEIFNNPGRRRVIDAVAMDTSGMLCTVPSGSIKPMVALGMILLCPVTGEKELTLWSKIISTAAELISRNECDQCRRLKGLIDSALDDVAVRRAVESMYEASFWNVMPLDSELDQIHSEDRFVLKGKTRMLVGYETEFSKWSSDA